MSRHTSVTGVALCLLAIAAAAPCTWGNEAPAKRCIAVELYLVGNAAQQQADLAFVRKVLEPRGGIRLRQYLVPLDAKAKQRYRSLCEHFKLPAAEKHALMFACNQVASVTAHDAAVQGACQAVFDYELYVRTGCPRCEQALPWVRTLVAQTPALQLVVYDVAMDPAAVARLARHAEEHQTRATSFPSSVVCDRVVVGWESEQTTGERIRKLLAPWTVGCAEAEKSKATKPEPAASDASQRQTGPQLRMVSLAESVDASAAAEPLAADEVGGELPLPGADEALPIDAPEEDSIDLPWFGTVRVSQVGLPLFTLSVGLIDGFNPCAMWVLLFLLSVLVNLKDRRRMLAVAGTFVVISGLAYFAFMTAWLNLLSWVGLLRWVQVVLACLAIFVGSVHVKDFFALHRGLTLSIPESAKPGIYARVRGIVKAETMWAALAGAIVLAVLVNFVELLCTAGLPALYSQILTMQQLPRWQEYLYLGLYILAYMFDDTLMVLGVVATLGHPKMQEVHGRWLKLLSGLVILALGLVMLLRPEWLT